MAFVGERSGGILTYSGIRVHDETVNEPLRLNVYKHGHGMANTYAGEISGKTNHVNTCLYCDQNGAEIILGDGTKRIYEKIKFTPSAIFGEELIPPLIALVDSPICYHLVEEILPSGNRIFFTYNIEGHVSHVEMQNNSNSKILSWIDFTYDFLKDGCQLTLTTSDDRILNYSFSLINVPTEGSVYLLKNITGSHTIPCSYNYEINNSICSLKSKFLSNTCCFKLVYDKNGFIEALYEQDISSDSFFPKYTFYYGQNYTQVTNAIGAKCIYRFNENSALCSIERFDNQNKLFRKDIKIWENTRLLSKGILDGDLKLLSYTAYRYDDQSNIIEENLYGNLTGKDEGNLFLDTTGKLLNPNKIECYQIHKTYSSDGFNNLIRLGEKDQTHTVFHYKSNSNLLIKEFLVNDGIKKRSFYFYNEDSSCIRRVDDDGVEEEESQLKGVTERHIHENKVQTTLPGVGLPLTIQEKVLDLSAREEVLLRRKINTFDSLSHLLTCDIYDAKENFVVSEQKKYNVLGLPIWENHLNHEYFYTYDDVGNLLSIFTPHLNKYIYNSYNSKNQLVQTTQCFNDQELVESYVYNFLGQKISSTDERGHITRYQYDIFGREIQITLPTFYNEQKQPENPVMLFGYDIFDNVISETDPQGHTTSKSYNLRGELTKILYPDGTYEWFRYETSGILQRKLSRQLILTTYEYDYQGRVTQEQIQECTEEKGISKTVQKKENKYNAFHCTESLDDRLKTAYEYDNAGRIATIIKTNKDSKFALECRKVEFIYDSQGRLEARKIWFDLGNSDYSLECYKYDIKGRLTEKCVENSSKEQLIWQEFSYSSDDRYLEEYGIIDGNKTLLSRTDYDPMSEPLRHTDALGNETTIEIDRFFVNAIGQLVQKKTITNALGFKTAFEFDTLGRVSKICKWDSAQILLSSQEFFYDSSGNKSQQIDLQIFEGQVIGAEESRWRYGPMHRLEEEVFHYGKPAESKIYYHYNSLGLLTEKTIPGSTEPMVFTYNRSGLVETICHKDPSQSQEFHIINNYKYDPFGNIIEATSHYDKIVIQRSYNAFNELIKELVSDRNSTYYETSYSYDLKGRLKTIALPDKSRIEYGYNAAFGTSVKRLSSNGDNFFSHYYTSFNLNGRLINESTQNYFLEHRYDIRGIQTETDSPFFKEKSEYDALERLTSIKKNEVKGASDSSFTYNDLSQLSQETGSCTNNYQCDSLDNILNINGVALNCSDTLITSYKDKSYLYDPQGNLLRKILDNQEEHYKINSLSQLVSIEKSDKSSLKFLYDAFGRRVAKKHLNRPYAYPTELVHQHYFYFGNQEIGSVDERRNVLELYIPGLEKENLSQQPVSIEIKGKSYNALHDCLGNVVALIDSKTNSVAESYSYSAFGQEVIYDSSNNIAYESLIGNPWKYACKRSDKETGLIFFGSRYYDPEIARWITPDLIGMQDGPNQYAYVHNNPLNNFDKFGFSTENRAHTHLEKQFYGPEKLTYSWYRGPSKRINQLPRVRYNYSLENGCPYHQQSRTYDLGIPDIPDVGIGYINGINNNFYEAWDGACYLSRIASGTNIHGVFNASRGIFNDLIECFMGLNFIATPSVYYLHEMWNEFFSRSSSDAMFLQICHSQGAIHVRNGLLSYPEELRKRILVVAIAPAAYIYSATCMKVTHYRAIPARDFIPLFDLEGLFRELDTTEVLQSHQNASLHDHSFQSETYERSLMKQIYKYLNSNRRM